ncbi:MAG: tRNA 4-thiouridine(8) synthase ThiI [Candidatus Izemoplasmatales bacterium]|nr:tRNA 4-thiouridine(8) synthase ThiI [Candidatus Izemoplasmatales bacterium]
MAEGILIRYGDLTLKGRNQKYFVKAINTLIREKLEGLPVTFDFQHDRAYAYFDPSFFEQVQYQLMYVTGLYSFSPIYRAKKELDAIAEIADTLIQEETQGRAVTFKVDTKRADKTYPMSSMDFSKELSRVVLRKHPNLKVDVHHPAYVLHVEIRREAAYLFSGQIMGLGGYPVPMGGKAMLLLSGGIDSPVAGFLTMKKGIEIEAIHFESTPLTPIESAQKVIDLASVLSHYAPRNSLKVLFVPFREIHEAIMMQTPPSYHITIMRRMMVRIATQLMKRRDALALVTGDSVGQVASQTLESMSTIQSVTDALILRPLTSLDKLDIIRIARDIGTMEISNRPFSDCCSVYVPENPSIRPQVSQASTYEKSFDFAPMIQTAVEQTLIRTFHPDQHVDLAMTAFTLQEAFLEDA